MRSKAVLGRAFSPPEPQRCHLGRDSLAPGGPRDLAAAGRRRVLDPDATTSSIQAKMKLGPAESWTVPANL